MATGINPQISPPTRASPPSRFRPPPPTRPETNHHAAAVHRRTLHSSAGATSGRILHPTADIPSVRIQSPRRALIRHEQQALVRVRASPTRRRRLGRGGRDGVLRRRRALRRPGGEPAPGADPAVAAADAGGRVARLPPALPIHLPPRDRSLRPLRRRPHRLPLLLRHVRGGRAAVRRRVGRHRHHPQGRHQGRPEERAQVPRGRRLLPQHGRRRGIARQQLRLCS
jgi:hypothetical protein